MPSIAIHDLSMSRALDREALAAIKGGGAPWVFGWIRPFVEQRRSFGPSVNFFQITNNFFAEQMVNQFQTIDVTNTAANSTIAVGTDATGGVIKQL